MKLQLFLTLCTAFLMIQCKPTGSLFLDKGSWEVNGAAEWQFDQDLIIGEADGEAGYLISNEEYGDFVMELEFWSSSEMNSGIFVRCTENKMTPMVCYEFNIYDNHPKPEYRTGAIVMKSPPSETVTTLNKWNTYKIKVKGNSLTAWVNGTKVVQITDKDRSKGQIGLQAAGSGKVMFKNVGIRNL